MGTSRRFKFRVYLRNGVYRVRNSLTSGTLRATFNTVAEALEAIKLRVASARKEMRDGKRSPRDKS